jgi:O-antigen/teichoic acid export membrane protein
MAVTVKVYTALDTTMLGFIKGDWAVGIYTASTKINKIVLSLVVSVGAVLFPRLSYYVNNEDKTSFTKLLHKGLDFYLLLSIPCSVALCILGKPIILLFSGENYLEAILVSRIMNPIIIIISLSNFIGIQLFLSINKEKWTFYSVLIGALANFFLNLFLISKYGAIGAAIATVIAESLVTCVQIFFARPYLDIRFLFKLFLIYLLNALIMGISIFVVLLTIQEIFLQLILGALIGSIVYIFPLYIQKNIMLFDFIFTVQNKLHK